MKNSISAAVSVFLILSASCVSLEIVQASTGYEGLPQISFSGEAEGQCLVLGGLGPLRSGDSPAYLGQGSISINGNAAAGQIIGDTFNVSIGPLLSYMPSGGVVSQGSLFASWSGQEINLTFSSNNAKGFFEDDRKSPDVFVAGMGSGVNYDSYTPTSSALSYSGTIKNSSGTFPISGYVVALASDVPTATGQVLGTVNMYVWVFRADGSSYKAFDWSPKTWLTPFGSPPITLNASTVFQRSVQVNIPKIALGLTTVIGGSGTVNQTTTGVSTNIRGASILNETRVNVTSISYGAISPFGTSNASTGIYGALFYDVKVSPYNGSLGTDAVVTVSISSPNFTSTSMMYYWNGTGWQQITTSFTVPNTVSATFNVSQLQGTPIMVGNSVDIPEVFPSWIILTLLIIVSLASAILFNERQKQN